MKLVHERKTIRKKKNNAKKQGVATRLRKKALLGANWFINDDVYKRIGELNRRYNFLETVFVAYPANEEYANAYVDKKHRHLMRWSPWPVSPFRQNGKWGITFVISATEDDFKDPHNYDNLS